MKNEKAKRIIETEAKGPDLDVKGLPVVLTLSSSSKRG
jgi:hypothetical protein